MPTGRPAVSLGRLVRTLTLLWLVGNGLRLTILAVPPVIPALRAELHLSGTEIGILTGLPIVMFAAAALPGSLLVARFGAVATMVIGLLLVALASALRASAATIAWLFAMTALMGAGVALAQPAMPALVRRWLPERIGLGTAVYTNGLLFGEILPVALFPALMAATGGWGGTFVFWAVPVALVAVIGWLAAPRDPAAAAPPPVHWWPDWREREIWRLGFIFASANTVYFATNAFIPGHLTDIGRADLVSPALTALNLGQLPASFLLIAFAERLERRSWPFVAAGAIEIAAIAGLVFGAGWVAVLGAAVIGFAVGGAFALGLTLPPLLSEPGEVARLSAAMFTVSYTLCVIISVISGAAWDLAGAAAWAFLPIALAALPAMLLAPSIRFPRPHR